MKIIVGLGNPGEKYKNTRHNIGFMVIDALAEKHDLKWEQSKKLKAEICKTKKTTLIKPQTIMNNSGQAVQTVLDYYKLLPKTLGLITKKQTDLSDKLIIIHDDIDIEFGKFKIQKNRSSAGHKGVRSIIQRLKTQNFTRMRVGAKDPDTKVPPSKFVLQNFSPEERGRLKKIIPRIIESILKK